MSKFAIAFGGSVIKLARASSLDGVWSKEAMTKPKNPDKAKRAANDPQRPGEECKAPPGLWRPVVDRQRCEGKADCLEVCPYDVFAIGPIDEAEYAEMPALVRFKLWVHGKKTAHTPNAKDCRACGLCVVACPERAITLVSVTPPNLRGAEV